jgi:hypothetical protein
LGRFNSPDNFVIGVYSSQAYNRYSYALNNPNSYTDPDGQWVQFVVGAAIGGYIGYKIGVASGRDWGSGLFWYTLAGAGIGAISGGVAMEIAGSGMAFAGTASIAAGSLYSSTGYHMLSDGRTPIVISVGAASYNLTENELGHLFKPSNSTAENIGYGLGAVANFSDIWALYQASYGGTQTGTVVYEYPEEGSPTVLGDIKAASSVHFKKKEPTSEYPHLKFIYDTEEGKRSISFAEIGNKANDFTMKDHYKTLEVTGVDKANIENVATSTKPYNWACNNCGQNVSKAIFGFKVPAITPAANFRYLQIRQAWRNFYGL